MAGTPLPFLPLHDLGSAPPASRELMARVRDEAGALPNLTATLAGSPELLQAHQTLHELFARTTFDAVERHVVLVTVADEKRCAYAVAMHAMQGSMQALPEDVLGALRREVALPDLRLEALRSFATALVRDAGSVDTAAFVAAGFTSRNALDVILAIATIEIASRVDRLANVPLDGFLQVHERSAPPTPENETSSPARS